jgi:hypothetical protein
VFKTFCKAAAVLAVVTLYGCAGPSIQKMQADVAGYTLPKPAKPDQGLVYVVRPSSVGELVRFNVFLDDHNDSSEMGYNRGNQYIAFYVTPGPHVISSKAENWAEMQVDLKPGQVLFLKQEVDFGVLMSRNSLVALDDTKGRYLVKDASLGTVKKESK